MAILEKINQDFKKALQERDVKAISTLRLLNSALQNKEIEFRPKKKELDDEAVVEVLQREVKKRKEAMEMFEKGGRKDLFSKEQEELEIISKYLPKQLSEEEIKKIIEKITQSLGEVSSKDFGKVMGMVMKEAKGKTDGNIVSRLVKETLEK